MLKGLFPDGMDEDAKELLVLAADRIARVAAVDAEAKNLRHVAEAYAEQVELPENDDDPLAQG